MSVFEKIFERGNERNSIEDIEKIEESGNMVFFKESDIDRYVETPLRKAVKELTEKGIKTLDTSANKENIDKEGYIIIEIKSLSDKNLKEAENIGEKIEYGIIKKSDAIKIVFKIEKGDTVEKIEKKIEEKIKNFEKQEPLWIPQFTAEELKNNFYFKEEEFEKEGYYFNPKTEKYVYGLWHANMLKLLEEKNEK
jgi:hypothetical protein